MAIRPLKVFELLRQKTENCTLINETPSRKEIQLCDRIISLINSMENDSEYDFEEDEFLQCNDDVESSEVEAVYENDMKEAHYAFLPLDYANRVMKACNEHPNWSFETIKSRFPKIKYPCYLERCKKIIEQQGSFREKVLSVTRCCWQQFSKARSEGVPIHDEDIRRWALFQANQIGFVGFKATITWVQTFKRKFHISSRKIVVFSSVKKQADVDKTIDRGVEFHLDFLDNIYPKYQPSEIFNTDQSGFNYTPLGNRTLSLTGEKTTLCTIAQINAHTHSYTIQPVISMEGKLISPMLICLQEVGGKFPPSIEIPSYKNLVIRCSKSGKLDKTLVKEFLEHVFKPIVLKTAGKEAVLIVDSWGAQKSDELYSDENITINLKILPEGSTGFMQPLDVFCFRQWKDFMKRFTQHALLIDKQTYLHRRENVLKIQSLILNQFQSSAYEPMLRYAWHKSGFEIPYEEFRGLKEVNFTFEEPVCEDCNQNITFIKCSYDICKKALCLDCFFTNYHYH